MTLKEEVEEKNQRLQKDLEKLENLIEKSSQIVFFGGAGVSTESGIPDFRSVDGLYNMEYDYPPEVILSHSFFLANPTEFFRFTRNKLIQKEAKPNAAHRALASLEAKGKLRSVITQNIDGLHQMAGSKRVRELHGSVHRNYCTKCHKKYTLEELPPYTDFPRCSCGGIIRPDVVLYEEPLDEGVMELAIEDLMSADLLIVAGTSLKVYPAAGMIRYYRGTNGVLINKSETDADSRFELVLREPVGEVLSKVIKIDG